MSDRLEIPPELLSLVEKREQADRRQNEAPPAVPEDRREAPRRAEDLPAAPRQA
ncbi:MAG TPA: hypothetical protein VEQ85_11930 [Lacipirellulaceae bacterium]|nr:hypothetical protein [Lacipirellulaceae bacterium]